MGLVALSAFYVQAMEQLLQQGRPQKISPLQNDFIYNDYRWRVEYRYYGKDT